MWVVEDSAQFRVLAPEHDEEGYGFDDGQYVDQNIPRLQQNQIFHVLPRLHLLIYARLVERALNAALFLAPQAAEVHQDAVACCDALRDEASNGEAD